MRPTYAIKFMEGKDTAVSFHRDKLGFSLKSRSPFSSASG
jgi:hypothetical protein